MNIGVRKWGTLIILSIIWGSSYILIKKGLTGLTPVQLGSLRMIITAILIVPFSINKLKSIPKKEEFEEIIEAAEEPEEETEEKAANYIVSGKGAA